MSTLKSRVPYSRRNAYKDHIRRNNLKYGEQMAASEGFYANFSELMPLHIINGIQPGDPQWEDVIVGAKFALKELNKNREAGSHLKLEKIVRVNYQFAGGVMYFITMQASDHCFYEAKVLVSSKGDDFSKVLLFRPACHYKEEEKEGHDPVMTDTLRATSSVVGCV